MNRRFSAPFSIFRVLLSLLLLHLLVDISVDSSTLTEKKMKCMQRKMDYTMKKILKQEEEHGRGTKSCSRTPDTTMFRHKGMDPTYYKWEHMQMPYDVASHYLLLQSETINDTEIQKMTSSGKYGQKYREACLKAKQTAKCDPNAKYRTADGQCNNLQNPTWGSTSCCQDRLLPAYYVGSSGYRQSVKGGELPNCRKLSLNLHYNVDKSTYEWSNMFVYWGQLLDHDITLTPSSTTADNKPIQCCPPKKNSHPQCKPIVICKDDPFYSKYNVTCLNFVRSAVCPTCSYGHRQVSEQVTSYVDCSFVYGNTEEEMKSLRKGNGGQMKVQESKYCDGPLPPKSFKPKDDQCSNPKKNMYCFQSGDPRGNQHTMVSALQTMYLRLHNKMAYELYKLNPHWNDEKTYQEARRMAGALMQSTTYNEYLPIVLGKPAMSYYYLSVNSKTKYNPQVKPCMYTEFTTAAFRYGHSLVNSVMAEYQYNGKQQYPELKDNYLNPYDLYKGTSGDWLKGACYSKPQQFDQYMVPDVTNYLYRHKAEHGSDLASLNICRGRDHGLPPYTAMVYYCSGGKIKIESWKDLLKYNLMKRKQMKELKRNYKDVKDVDMFPGCLMENRNEYGVVGPTAKCVIGRQFYNLKYGDSYFYSHDNGRYPFTDEQVEQINNTTLSKIICYTTCVDSMQQNALLFPGDENPVKKCKDWGFIDFSLWKEKNVPSY